MENFHLFVPNGCEYCSDPIIPEMWDEIVWIGPKKAVCAFCLDQEQSELQTQLERMGL